MVIIIRNVNFIVSILIILMCITDIYSQISRDLRFIMENTHEAQSYSESLPDHVFYETSEAKILVLGILRTYQVFVSSQQNNLRVCTFLPSCSNFSIMAIKKHGLSTGLLLAADRLQRCHANNSYFYLLHSGTGKRLDPVENYFRYSEPKRHF